MDTHTHTRRYVPLVIAAGVVLVVAAVLAVVLATRPGAHATGQPTSTTTSAATPAATTPAADPYAVYLAHNPDPSLVLSREDAQARAYLGCGQTFAPGTIDAALADAYRPTGLCGKS